MPPRRNPQRNMRDVVIEDLQREIQQLQQQLTRSEQREQEEPQEEEEELNPFHHDLHSEDQDGRRTASGLVRPFREDKGVNIDLPEFDGRLDPDEFVNWIHTIERIIGFKEIPSDWVVKLVAIKLKKSASLWWKILKRNRNLDGRSKITMWAKMKKELYQKYLLEIYRQDLFLKLHRMQQHQFTVEEYIAEFDQLLLQCDLSKHEENTVAQFLEGLHPSIVNIVQLQPYWTLQDVFNLSLKVEGQQRTNKNKCNRNKINTQDEDLERNHFKKPDCKAGGSATMAKEAPRISKADGPFHIMKKINQNAYQIDLPGDYNISTTFNVVDLTPHYDLDASPTPGE